MEEHVGYVTLVCSNCLCERKWESSEKFRDGSYKLNEKQCVLGFVLKEKSMRGMLILWVIGELEKLILSFVDDLVVYIENSELINRVSRKIEIYLNTYNMHISFNKSIVTFNNNKVIKHKPKL